MKRLSFTVLLVLLLPLMLFAGELSLNLRGDFTLPVTGWTSRNGMENGFDIVSVDKLIGGGVLGAAGADYWFNRSFALGLSAGIGFNELAFWDYCLVTVPVTLDFSFGFLRTENITFPVVLSLGVYGAVRDKVVSLGGVAALSFGMDVRFTEHFSFGFQTRCDAFFEPSSDFRDMSIQLNAVPFAMTMKCWI